MKQRIFRPALRRFIAACALLFLSPSVFAYLDPSTGSMVVSLIVGVFASIALALKTYWYRIKRFFKQIGKPASDPAKESSTKE